MRTWRAMAVVMLLGLLGTACGSRLPAAERTQAANALLNGGTTSNSGSVLPGTTATQGPGSSRALPTTGPGAQVQSGGGSGPTVVGQQGGGGGGSGPQSTTGPQAAASSCPTSGTDVGLTSNQVTLGTIASVTGPVSGLFEGAFQGIRAFAAFMNSQGGLCGHGVQVQTADDGTNCAQNQNDTESLAKKVFALVGSFSLYDGCGAAYIQQHNIPDFHVQLDSRAVAPASHFDLEPGPPGYATGMFAYFRQKLGSKVQHVGTIYPDIPSAAEKQKAFVNSAESQGWKFVYSKASAATDSDWVQPFVQMCKQDGVQVFFTSAENAGNAAKMLQDEDQAGCPSTLINIIPIAYDQAFVQAAGNSSRLQGLMGWNEYSLFFNKDEAQQIPELQQLQAWFARVNPGKPLNLYALFAWAEGRLFQQAFENAGKVINRKTLIAAAAKINNFDANGIMAPMDPGSKTEGVHCYVLWEYNNGFHRMDTPPGKYRCDGRFLPYTGG